MTDKEKILFLCEKSGTKVQRKTKGNWIVGDRVIHFNIDGEIDSIYDYKQMIRAREDGFDYIGEHTDLTGVGR